MEMVIMIFCALMGALWIGELLWFFLAFWAFVVENRRDDG